MIVHIKLGEKGIKKVLGIFDFCDIYLLDGFSQKMLQILVVVHK